MFIKVPSFQLSVALLVLFVSYALQVRCQPYMSPSEHGSLVHKHRKSIKKMEEQGKIGGRKHKMQKKAMLGGSLGEQATIVAKYFYNCASSSPPGSEARARAGL